MRGGPPHTIAKTDGFAIAALVFAVIGGLCISPILSLVARSRIKTSNGAKTGMGLVKASWAICALWIVGLAALVALAPLLEDENADDYVGVERDVALVIDGFEENDPEDTCRDLVTPALRDALNAAFGSCAEGMTVDGLVAEIDVLSISIDGDTATVVVEELSDRLIFMVVNDGTSWRIDDIQTT